jgi:hypothetical protein
MTNHDITNKLAAAIIRLRMADTLCANAGVIDEIREAIKILTDVGDAVGKTLTKEK